MEVLASHPLSCFIFYLWRASVILKDFLFFFLEGQPSPAGWGADFRLVDDTVTITLPSWIASNRSPVAKVGASRRAPSPLTVPPTPTATAPPPPTRSTPFPSPSPTKRSSKYAGIPSSSQVVVSSISPGHRRLSTTHFVVAFVCWLFWQQKQQQKQKQKQQRNRLQVWRKAKTFFCHKNKLWSIGAGWLWRRGKACKKEQYKGKQTNIITNSFCFIVRCTPLSLGPLSLSLN